MHWLDRATTLTIRRTPPRRRAFGLGWGDRSIVDWYLRNAAIVPHVEPADPAMRPARRIGPVVMRDLTFDSPFDMLPDAARLVRGRWITTHPEPERVVVLHPAWNDEGYDTRARMARILLERGVASIMIQHPLYGDRGRRVPLDFPVPLVSDFCVMGRAAVLEGMALATHLHRAGYRVGVSGYSMGGNIAGFVGALAGVPIATAALAASHAAAPVFLGGVLRHTIAWDALGGRTEAVVDRLGAVLGAGSILNHPAPPHGRTAVIVGGTRDGYVPTSAVQAIHRHWPGSRMVWVKAGHASLLVRHRRRLVDAVVDSFDRLEAWEAGEERITGRHRPAPEQEPAASDRLSRFASSPRRRR
jgi:hypothetical protein